jgi:hypothetical protein
VKKIILLAAGVLTAIVFDSPVMALGQRAERNAAIGYRLVSESSSPGTVIARDVGSGTEAVIDRGDSVVFIKPSGRVTQRIEKAGAARMVQSRNGAYLGIQRMSESSDPGETARAISFTLYDNRGEKLWSLTDPLDADEPVPSWYISNRGRAVSVSPTASRLRFMGPGGAVEQKVVLFPDSSPEMERPIACAFSDDGERLAVSGLHHYPRPGDEMTPRQRGESYLVLLTENGKELWRRPLEEEIPGPVAISGDGKTIAAVAFSVRGEDLTDMRTHIYNDEGRLLGSVDMAFRLAAFSSDGARLLLSRKSDLRLVDTADGKTIWEERLATEHGQIRAVDLSSDGALALAVAAPSRYQDGGFHFTPVHAVLYGHRGQSIWSQSFADEIPDRPLARLYPDGSGFTLALRNRYLTYEQE